MLFKKIYKLVLIVILIFGSTLSAETHPDDVYWADGFYWPGQNEYQVSASSVLSFNNKIIIAGQLAYFGDGHPYDLLGGNVFSYDGQLITQLDTTLDFYVKDMIEYNNKLIVGGRSSDTLGNIIASWNGNNWHQLGLGIKGSISQMIAFDGNLIVCGLFRDSIGQNLNQVLSWDGINWTTLGGDFDSSITSLTFFEGKLIAGGNFTHSDTTAINHLAVWDGNLWAQFENGKDESIKQLIVWDSVLVVSGLFENNSQVAVRNTPNSWTHLPFWRLDDTASYYEIADLVVFDGNLVVGNKFTHLVMWNGVKWLQFEPILYGHIWSLAIHNNKLIVAGSPYYPPKGSSAFCIWDDTTWVLPFSIGIKGPVYNLHAFNNQLFAGGNYTHAGNNKIKSLAAFDGNSWSPLDSFYAEHIIDMIEYDGKLIVGGEYINISGVDAYGCAVWDGYEWSAMEDDSTVDVFFISDFKFFNEQLIALGQFKFKENQYDFTTHYIAKWDGTSWTKMGVGLKGTLTSMEVYKNKLYVSGEFDTVGTVGELKKDFAVWDGQSWETFDLAISKYNYQNISLLYSYKDKLLISGNFIQIDSIPARGLVLYDGNSFTKFGTGLSNTYSYALTAVEYDNQLIIGGKFDSVNGIAANNIASFDGEKWHPLGSGVQNPEGWDIYNLSYGTQINDIEVYNNELYVGGSFLKAGNKISANIAKWNKKYATDTDEPNPPNELPSSFELKQNYPNPFNPGTTIEYQLQKKSQISIQIFNILGQQIRTLIDETKPAGHYSITWNGKDDNGTPVATGMYLYKLQTNSYSETKKMLLLK